MNRFLLAGLLALAPGLSFAASEVYGGIGAGFAVLEIDDEPLPVGDLFLKQEISGSDFSARVYLGVRYGRFLGLEVGYTDFGTVNDDVPFGLPPFVPPFVIDRVNTSIDTSAIDTFLVGYYPLNQDLNLFVKVGIARWDVDYEYNGGEIKRSDDGTDLSYGLGAEYRATPRLKLRVDLQYYDLDFTDDLWTLTASVKYGIPFGR